MSRHDATLNLASLLKHHPDLGDEVAGSGELAPSRELLAEDGLTLAEPLAWRLSVRSTGGDDDLIVTGAVSGTAVQECRRCLTRVETRAHTSLIYPMSYRPKGSGGLTLLEADDEDDLLVFSHPEVDFAPLLTQLFAIELPLTALCKEDCKGLSLTGVNLNEHPEAQVPQEPEKPSPFASLKDLLKL